MRSTPRVVVGAVAACGLAAALIATARLAAQDTFPPKSDLQLQLHELVEDHAMDDTCGPPGDPPSIKKASRAQNRAKNNFFIQGETVTITQGVFRMLQKRTDDRSIPHGSDNALPADRSILANFLNDRGVMLGEGTLVRFATRVVDAHFSNKSNGESVNCHETGEEGNDIHIVLLSAMTLTAAKGVTVGYVNSGRLTKPAAVTAADRSISRLLTDDSGHPDLTKIQMMAWTVLTGAIYLSRVMQLTYANIHRDADLLQMPDIDKSLMLLMGLGQGTYLGKKVTSMDSDKPGA
jgi:hypothetical protein